MWDWMLMVTCFTDFYRLTFWGTPERQVPVWLGWNDWQFLCVFFLGEKSWGQSFFPESIRVNIYPDILWTSIYIMYISAPSLWCGTKKWGERGDRTMEQSKAVAVKGKALGDSLTLLHTVRWSCGKIVSGCQWSRQRRVLFRVWNSTHMEMKDEGLIYRKPMIFWPKMFSYCMFSHKFLYRGPKTLFEGSDAS